MAAESPLAMNPAFKILLVYVVESDACRLFVLAYP